MQSLKTALYLGNTLFKALELTPDSLHGMFTDYFSVQLPPISALLEYGMM